MVKTVLQFARNTYEFFFSLYSTNQFITQYLQTQERECLELLRKRHDVLSKLLHRYLVCKQGDNEKHAQKKELLLECLRDVMMALPTAQLVHAAQQIHGNQKVQKVIFDVITSREDTDLNDVGPFICTNRLEGCEVLAEAHAWCSNHIKGAQISLLLRYALGGCDGRYWSAVVTELLSRGQLELVILEKLQWKADIKCEASILAVLDNRIKALETA